MTVRIRPATVQDLPRMAGLLGLLFAQESDFRSDAKKQMAGLRAILRDPKVGSLWVATSDRAVIGMVGLLYTVSTAEGGRVAWLEDLVVDPAYRGQGVGKRLVTHVLQVASHNGFKRVTLLTDPTNRRAKKLYETQGFQRSRMVPFRLICKTNNFQ